jgi:hypothetical protein
MNEVKMPMTPTWPLFSEVYPRLVAGLWKSIRDLAVLRNRFPEKSPSCDIPMTPTATFRAYLKHVQG